MREIIFRGKRVDNSEWVEGSLDCNLTTELCFIRTPNSIYTDVNMVIPETVGQYTGLRDCKRTEEYPEGQKIFEGDILTGAWNTIFQVVYDDCYLGFRAKEKDGLHRCIDYYGLDRIEVIDNIHDNPKSIGGGENA